MDMQAALNDLQIMDVDARSGENGVTGDQSGEHMDGIPQPLNNCQHMHSFRHFELDTNGKIEGASI
jgi:hypothetical protein